MPEEWAGTPPTSSRQLEELRRAMTPKSPSTPRAPASKPRARSLRTAASTRASRATSRGRPGASSSPVRTTMIPAPSSAPSAWRARRAERMTMFPPFMSLTPGPWPVSPSRSKRWKGESGSKTVSRCPMSRRRWPLVPSALPVRSATRCPPRPMASGSAAYRTENPSASNSGARMSCTARTPAGLRVPEFTFTVRSSSATSSSNDASTWVTRRRSISDSPGWAAAWEGARAKKAPAAARAVTMGAVMKEAAMMGGAEMDTVIPGDAEEVGARKGNEPLDGPHEGRGRADAGSPEPAWSR